MKKSIKFLTFLLAVIFIFPLFLTACGSDSGDGDKGDNGQVKLNSLKTIITETSKALDNSLDTLANVNDPYVEASSEDNFPPATVGDYLDNCCGSLYLPINTVYYLINNQTGEAGYDNIEYDKAYVDSAESPKNIFKVVKNSTGVNISMDMVAGEQTCLISAQIVCDDNTVKELNVSTYVEGSNIMLTTLDFENKAFNALSIMADESAKESFPTADEFNSGSMAHSRLLHEGLSTGLYKGKITDKLENLNLTGWEVCDWFTYNKIETYNTLYKTTSQKCKLRRTALNTENAKSLALYFDATTYATTKRYIQTEQCEGKNYYVNISESYAERLGLLNKAKSILLEGDIKEQVDSVSATLILTYTEHFKSIDEKRFTCGTGINTADGILDKDGFKMSVSSGFTFDAQNKYFRGILKLVVKEAYGQVMNDNTYLGIEYNAKTFEIKKIALCNNESSQAYYTKG